MSPTEDGRRSSYRTQSSDTEPEVERYLVEKLRGLPAWRKAAMISAACGAARDLAMAGLRARHPGEPEGLLRKRYAALTLGRDASLALFGWDPDREGW